MKQDILITIGIPVYNGESTIAELIKSIIIPYQYIDRVEILVSDNCSIDNTKKIATAFNNVTYYCNEENVGYDKNLCAIFEKAKGSFVWTIGADDIIFDNNIWDFLFNLLSRTNDVSVIHVGGIPLLENEFLLCIKGEEFFYNSKFQCGFTSSNIISKELFLHSNYKNYFNTGWIHFGVILELIIKTNSVVTKKKFVIENPNFSNKKKEWDKNGNGLLLMLKLVKIFTHASNYEYSKNFIRKSKFLIKNNYPKEIIKAKANGLIVTKKIIYDFIFCYYEFLSFWIIDLPFLFIPHSLARLIYSKR